MISRSLLCLLVCPAVFLLAGGCSSTDPTLVAPEEVDASFAASALAPEHLLTEDAVTRMALHHFEVHEAGRATETVRRVVTVLRPAGREWGDLVVSYDTELWRLASLTGAVRDAAGQVVRRLREDDQEDYSFIDDATLYNNVRVRVARLYHDAYPYTVEYEYVREYRSVLEWPDWYPQEGGLPVEHAAFELVVPRGVPVRYRTQHFEAEPEIDPKSAEDRTETLAAPALSRPAAAAATFMKPCPASPAFRTAPKITKTATMLTERIKAAATRAQPTRHPDVRPGGENQREMAFRLGINLVMYALCVNYKADQVHVPFILKRRKWKVD